MSYSDALRSTLPPSILAEDEEVSVFPLNVTNVEIREASEMFRN